MHLQHASEIRENPSATQLTTENESKSLLQCNISEKQNVRNALRKLSTVGLEDISSRNNHYHEKSVAYQLTGNFYLRLGAVGKWI